MSSFRGSKELTRDWKHFRFEVRNGIASLTFDRPEKLNALTFEAYADLRDLLAELPGHEDARVLVLAGTGRGFCSGGDVHEIIGELLRMDGRRHLEFTRMTCDVVQRMRELPLPIIAKIQGIAAGAGSVIALAADFRLLSRSASFAFLFTKVGLSGGDMGSAYLLPRLVGLGHATELLMLGDKIDAGRALEIGLANQVFEDGELDEKTGELATRLAQGPCYAYANTKRLLSRELDMDLSGSLELDAVAQAHLMSSRDFREFYDAFNEKRKPDWKGR
ncbi:MAG: enoyl-CoA hydratase family protein [Planctomycetota bacterium]